MGHISLFTASDVMDDSDLMCGVGRLICAWGVLEQRLERKILTLRDTAGDIRTLGLRNKPSIAKMMGELRAMVSMRDRRNAAVLTEIAGIERDIQRIDRFRGLVVSGFQAAEPGGFTCRDGKNNVLRISKDQLAEEIDRLERIGEQLLAL